MSNRLKEIVGLIKAKEDKNVEEIAGSIGYSRIHLQKEINKPQDNENLIRELTKKYPYTIQNVSRGTYEQYVLLLEENADLRKRINGLEGKIDQLLTNYDALQEILSFADAKQRKSLELIAGHLTGEHKLKKAQEFLDTYDNVPFSLAEKKRKAGIRSGADKVSKDS